jgi:hypothetical protein
VRTRGEVAAVHLLDEVERGALRGLRRVGRGGEVEDRVLARAKDRALIDGREVTRSVTLGSGLHRAIGHHDKRGKVLVLGTESVDGPGSERGLAGELRPRGEQIHGGRVVEGVPVTGTDNRHVVDVARHVREEFGDFDAGLARGDELPGGTADDGLSEVDAAGFEAFNKLGGNCFAVPLGESRLGVPGVDVGDTAVHEEVDDGLGARLGMRGLGSERGSREKRAGSRGAETETGARE